MIRLLSIHIYNLVQDPCYRHQKGVQEETSCVSSTLLVDKTRMDQMFDGIMDYKYKTPQRFQKLIALQRNQRGALLERFSKKLLRIFPMVRIDI
jgi:hypothetical protein